MKIIHLQGRTLDSTAMVPNSIALDGAHQGPFIDAGNRIFSFDHHGGCVRLITLATCQQVYLALRLGLVTDENTTVYVNDVDADTALALWLLKHPEVVFDGDDDHTYQMVQDVGFVDAHGPVLSRPHPLHAALFTRPGDSRRMEDEYLEWCLKEIDLWYNDPESYEQSKQEKAPGKGWATKDGKSWDEVETPDGFAPLYRRGYKVIAIGTRRSKEPETITWTIAKISDLFPWNLQATLKFLGQHELDINPDQDPTSNWGGGSTVGGSPRNSDGTSSRITHESMGRLLGARI